MKEFICSLPTCAHPSKMGTNFKQDLVQLSWQVISQNIAIILTVRKLCVHENTASCGAYYIRARATSIWNYSSLVKCVQML